MLELMAGSQNILMKSSNHWSRKFTDISSRLYQIIILASLRII
jgi:hypothetical protein